jgi:hypothetical protein
MEMQLVHIKSEYYGNIEEAYKHEDAFAIIAIVFEVGKKFCSLDYTIH